MHLFRVQFARSQSFPLISISPQEWVFVFWGNLRSNVKCATTNAIIKTVVSTFVPWGGNPCPHPSHNSPNLNLPLPLIPPREGTLEQAMVDLREGKISPDVEKLGTLYVKSKLKASNDGSAILKTGGKVSQPKLLLTFVY